MLELLRLPLPAGSRTAGLAVLIGPDGARQPERRCANAHRIDKAQCMPSLRHLRCIVVAAPALWLCTVAAAIGLGPVPSSVALGQALDMAVPVRLDAAEQLGAECVAVEVWAGESKLPPNQVQMRVEAANGEGAVIRIATTRAIDEPLVTLQLAAGCTSRVSRRFVVFADPGKPPPVPVGLLPAAATVAEAQREGPASVSPALANEAAPVAADVTAAVPAATGLPAAAMVTQRRTPRAARAVARRGTADVRPRAHAPRAAAAPVVQRVAPVDVVRRERPRLLLEPAERPLAQTAAAAAAIDEALAVVAQAASSARAAAAAAASANQRAASLEQALTIARRDASARDAEVEALRERLGRSRDASGWVGPMLVLIAVLAAAALWLAWRLRALQHSHAQAWARASAQAGREAAVKQSSPLPLIPTDSPTLPARNSTMLAPQTAPMAMHPDPQTLAAEATAAAERSTMRTLPLPPSVSTDAHSPRDVSIEELIDLEQQAEFFVALGQDMAAIDLLVAHLRSTGGGSPLTYLKLLEIYSRVGDRDNYERTRARFNQRFNAYAPDWGTDLAHGRSLEDYEGVLPRLQEAWPRPLDAMAELEALLFRKSRGELFDLPAYREVLLLYSVARDLLDREPVDRGNVDLLLPLEAGVAAAGTPAIGNSRARSEVPDDERPTAPLDLDLTPPPRSGSIFGAPPSDKPAGRS
jgi:hypothetical protein